MLRRIIRDQTGELDSGDGGGCASALVIGVCVVSLLVVTAAESGKGNHKDTRPEYTSKDEPLPFMARMYKEHKVVECVGRSFLRKDGHVREQPYAQDDATQITAFNDDLAHGMTIKITDPHLVKIKQTTDGPSDRWYVEKLPDSDNRVYVNHDALMQDNFTCTTPALSPNLYIGTISVTR